MSDLSLTITAIVGIPVIIWHLACSFREKTAPELGSLLLPMLGGYSIATAWHIMKKAISGDLNIDPQAHIYLIIASIVICYFALLGCWNSAKPKHKATSSPSQDPNENKNAG